MIRGAESPNGFRKGQVIEGADFTDAEIDIFVRAAQLARDAIKAGVTLEIVHRPLMPLAMGHYEHEITTNTARVMAEPIQR